MAGHPDTVRVIVRGGGITGRPLCYERKILVGLTIKEATRILQSSGEEGELPDNVVILEPCFLNRKKISWSSEEVLKGGDTLSFADP